MTWSDKDRAEVAARNCALVRCPVPIIPPGVTAADTDPWATDGAVRCGRLLIAKAHENTADLRDSGASFREIGRYLNRSYSHVHSVPGGFS